MKDIVYRGKKFYEVLRYTDFHEYIDGCGRAWLISDDFKYRCRLPA